MKLVETVSGEAFVRKGKRRAAAHGRSMEDEARDILRAALSIEAPAASDLGQAIRARFAGLGGVDLAPPMRAPIRERTDFGG